MGSRERWSTSIALDHIPAQAPKSRVHVAHAVGYSLALALGAAAFVVMGMIARQPVRPSWEMTVDRMLMHHPPPWVRGVTALFNPASFVVLILALLVVALVRRRRTLALGGTAGCILAVLSAERVFKILIDDGYPSAHVTAAAAFSVFAWCLVEKRRVIALTLFVIPLVLVWAVVARGMHFPVAAVGGLLLGPLAVGTTIFAVTYAELRVRERTRRRVGSPP
jgi:membrane-associated phospholipid phosphatase